MSTSKHPKGLYLIFATSTAERFSYYGMRAIFILFLTQALLFDKEHAASIYGSYTGLVYLTPLIGGYIADKYWGIRRSVFWGAMMMAVGQFLMFFSASMLDTVQLSHWLMYGGLTFLILGNGQYLPSWDNCTNRETDGWTPLTPYSIWALTSAPSLRRWFAAISAKPVIRTTSDGAS